MFPATPAHTNGFNVWFFFLFCVLKYEKHVNGFGVCVYVWKIYEGTAAIILDWLL